MTFHHLRAPRPAVAPPAALQIGPVTLALRAVRQSVDTPRQVGPVVAALRTMRAAVPDFDGNPDVRALRRALADRIEADLAALDALGGDADDEPSLGAPEPLITQWTLTGPDGRQIHPGDQMRWATSATDDREEDAGDEREEENEHGGNVEDEGEDSLGSLGGTAPGLDMAQSSWSKGRGSDREDEHDGREPDEDFEAVDYADLGEPGFPAGITEAR